MVHERFYGLADPLNALSTCQGFVSASSDDDAADRIHRGRDSPSGIPPSSC